VTIEPNKDLETRQQEMKARLNRLKKSNPEKWEAQEIKDKVTLDKYFPQDAQNHRKAAR
jgi:hypothetical protein